MYPDAPVKGADQPDQDTTYRLLPEKQNHRGAGAQHDTHQHTCQYQAAGYCFLLPAQQIDETTGQYAANQGSQRQVDARLAN